MPKPPDIDFPTSAIWREYYAKSGKLSQLKKPQPKTIEVSGITLHNISTGDRIDETNHEQLEENLKKLGIHPVETAFLHQTDFLHLVPSKKGREPKKITPPLLFRSDPERGMANIMDETARNKALMSDVSHDNTVRRQQLRKRLGLPEKARPYREILSEIITLTPEDFNYLETLGYHQNRTRPYAPLTLEKMLHDLHRHKEAVQAMEKV